MKHIYSTIAIAIVLSFALTSCSKKEKPAEKTADTYSDSSHGSIYAVNLTLDDQDGRKVEWQSLQGKVRVMAMVFTHCPAICPRNTHFMKDVEQLIPSSDRDDVAYTLISFDSKRDSASVLKAFYQEHGLDPHWQLLHGNASDIQMIGNLLDIKYKELPNGDFDHDNVVVVVGKDGQIVLRDERFDKDTKAIAEKVRSMLSH